jgi:3-oxoacyl-[acyl-carrier-protein] synthase III
MKHAVISSTGSYLPGTVIHNQDMVQFSKEARHLIFQKTGVCSRRIANESECTSDLAVKAAMHCLEKITFSPERIDGIILSTSSPDRMQPATATRVQHMIGAKKAFAFDINSVCSGSVLGITIANALIKAEIYQTILYLAAEMYSKILNKNDFSTYPYFGDGAGAILFQADTGSARGVLHSCLRTEGSGSDTICVPGGGTIMPYEKMTSLKSAYFQMKGIDVFNFAVEKGSEVILQLIREANIDISDVACFICHQANINILEKIAENIGVSSNLFFVNLDRYGNTASASVPIALDEALSEGIIIRGDLVITVAFGGGLSWGANLIKI